MKAYRSKRLILYFLLVGKITFSQTTYFQQHLDYHIQVQLDDVNHLLLGHLALNYVNQSPDTLSLLYWHLWPNAYQNKSTAFAEQQLEDYNTEFYFAASPELGYIDSLDFRAAGLPLKLEYDPDYIDMAKTQLNKPLLPGDTIKITTPFRVKIPNSYSRLGHVGQSYQITQWFPKPAVYDQLGWHPMPYLDRGEFYSEFGNFKVEITLPENYLVAGTGHLQTESERNFLQAEIAKTNLWLQEVSEGEAYVQPAFPPSSPGNKTIVFEAEQVHDFAWFADKRFKVQKSAVDVNGKQVDTWAFFTAFEFDLWQSATEYLNRSVVFYSDLVGPYPYPQATAVQSALSAGSGMEYPMITVIGPSYTKEWLDRVITHEVGHNWFYGILATNERDFPWMDEGMNSYYEQRYMEQFYSSKNEGIFPPFLMGDSTIRDWYWIEMYLRQKQALQAIQTKSQDFTAPNYLLGAYEKPAAVLHYLAAYLGTEQLDSLMQAYYDEWKFKHPYPKNFEAIFKSEDNLPKLESFFNLLNTTEPFDYSIEKVEKQTDQYIVSLKNRGGLAGPILLTGMTDQDSIVFERWLPGFLGTQEIAVPVNLIRKFILDPNHISPDINLQNNYYHLGHLFPKIEPFRLDLLPKTNQGSRTNLYLHPLLLWNVYDNWMPGIALHNLTLPTKTIQFMAAPVYSLSRKTLNGNGQFRIRANNLGSVVQGIQFGVRYKAFHFDRINLEDGPVLLKFERWEPFVQLDFKKALKKTFKHQLRWRSILIRDEAPRFSNMGDYEGLDSPLNTIHELTYQGKNYRALNPFDFQFTLENQAFDLLGQRDHYWKAAFAWTGNITFAPKRHFQYRLFLGTFLKNTRRNAGIIIPGAFNLASQGYNDYRLDGTFLGRNAENGIWSQQIRLEDGGMKLPLGPSISLGQSNNFIWAINLKTDLPENFLYNLPIKPYFDLGYFDNATPLGTDAGFNDQLLWSGGVEIQLVKNWASIYLPFINSKNVNNILRQNGNYWSRISFTLAFEKINLFEATKTEIKDF